MHPNIHCHLQYRAATSSKHFAPDIGVRDPHTKSVYHRALLYLYIILWRLLFGPGCRVLNAEILKLSGYTW